MVCLVCFSLHRAVLCCFLLDASEHHALNREQFVVVNNNRMAATAIITALLSPGVGEFERRAISRLWVPSRPPSPAIACPDPRPSTQTLPALFHAFLVSLHFSSHARYLTVACPPAQAVARLSFLCFRVAVLFPSAHHAVQLQVNCRSGRRLVMPHWCFRWSS